MLANPKKLPQSLVDRLELSQNLPIFLLLSIAIILYVFQIGEESLWSDEFYSLYDATAIPQTIPITRPLYYLLLRGWMFFGQSDAWLRALSIPFSLGSIFLTYQLGLQLLNRYTGLVAATLLTLSPLFVNHTQEIRMYTLSTFLGLLGSLLLFKAFNEDKKKYLFGWFPVRVLAVLTTPINILLFLPDSILLLWHLRKQRRLLLLIGGVLLGSVLIALPWLLHFASTSFEFFGGWVADSPKPGVTSILSRLTNFTAYWPLQAIESPLGVKFYKMYTIIAGLVLATAFFNKGARPAVLYLAAWALLPAAVMFTVSWLFAPVWVPRYLLFVAPYLFLLLAIGFLAIQKWQPKLAIVIAIVYLVAVGGGLQSYYSKKMRDDWRNATQMINALDQQGDVIVIHTNFNRPKLFVEHYYDGEAPISVINLSENTAQLPSFESRLWVVHKDSDADSELSQTFKQNLAHEYTVEEHQTFENETGFDEIIEVFLLTQK